MAVHAVIFDLGGVLLEIDWERYHEDQQSEIMSNDLRPYEQLNARMLQLIKRLRPTYTIASICNGGSRQAMMRKFRLHELIDLMVFDDEEGVSKPDERMYLLTLKKLGLHPAEVVFIDDKDDNVKAAQRLGIHSIHFKNARQAISELDILLAQGEKDSAQ